MGKALEVGRFEGLHWWSLRRGIYGPTSTDEIALDHISPPREGGFKGGGRGQEERNKGIYWLGFIIAKKTISTRNVTNGGDRHLKGGGGRGKCENKETGKE